MLGCIARLCLSDAKTTTEYNKEHGLHRGGHHLCRGADTWRGGHRITSWSMPWVCVGVVLMWLWHLRGVASWEPFNFKKLELGQV